MSWSWFSQLSDAFKKRVGKYLINRYLGPFLDEGILLNQLSVDGPIRLRDVALNTSYINAFLEDSEIPLEFIDGYIQELSVTVPMANLLKDNCIFEINGLTLTLQVKRRAHLSQVNASVFFSMYESFSSLNVAEDCLKQNDVTDSPGRSTLNAMGLGGAAGPGADSSVLGVELLAEAIDSIIMRVQVLLTDTTVRVEYVPTVAPKGLALELRVGKISYAGESLNSDTSMTNSTTKKVSFEDVHLFSDEFSFRRQNVTPDRDSDDQDNESAHFQHREDRQPLKLAALTGRHEVVVRFADTNHFGLPRTLEEVEINLGGLLLHLFPHQIHTVVELLSAMAASRPNQDSPSRQHNRDTPASLESVLQQSMILEPVGLQCRDGWSSANDEDLTSRSSEFVAMPKLKRHHRHSLTAATDNVAPASSPRVIIRAVNLLASMVERDEGVAKLGGESNKALAMDKMHEMAAKFFSAASNLDWARIRSKIFDSKNESLTGLCQSSHIQVVCSPLSIVHEEGRQDGSVFPDDFLTKTSVTLGQLSVREILWPMDVGLVLKSPVVPEVIALLQFDPAVGSNPYQKPADFKLVIKETRLDDGNLGNNDRDDGPSGSHSSITLRLNPCTVNFDPGVIDRTYMLCNYTEFDPNCLMTPDDARVDLNASETTSSLLVNVLSPQIYINFFVPKADMRNPPEVPIAEFVSAFWTRTVHPEIFQIDMADLDLTVTRDEATSPVVVALGTNRIAINFQENASSEKLPLLVSRKSQRNSELAQKRAAYITVTVQTAELNEEIIKKNGFHEVPRPNATYFGSSATEEGAGGATSNVDNRSSVLRQALEHGRLHNNLGLGLQFDELSLVVPNKHAYELIYNRLGNDLLLWTPVFLRVKQFLFHQPVPDPLRDPDSEFQHCASGAWQQGADHNNSIPLEMSQSIGAGDNLFDLFPKSNLPGLTIHTDTYVSLSINKGFVSICSNVCDQDQLQGNYIFSAILSTVELQTAVGLERSPDICLLGVCIKDGTISFGKTASRLLNVRGTHFNEKPAGEGSSTLLERTHWHHFNSSSTVGAGDDNLLQLTSKILFDSQQNLKTIDLGIVLRETSICWSLASTAPPPWINWLVDFFTVVEYPVVGYIPPAILTELRFDLRHCTFDVTHNTPPGRLTLALGHVRVHCNLLDTGRDVSISLSVEDAALYASIDQDNFLTTSICFCDLDYLDLNVSLLDEPKPILDVGATCNQLRLRTCVDTIAHITDVIKAVTAASSAVDEELASSSLSRQSSVETSNLTSIDNEDIVPDLAEAMAELDNARRSSENGVTPAPDGKSRLQKGSRKRGGGQVFFFPDENLRLTMESSFPDGLGMTESFYQGSADQELDVSDDSMEGFCFLDAIGTGFTKNGEASIQHLDEEPVVFVENHFPPPEKSIDYLKTPQGFPAFQSRITLKRISILWQIYGGKDLSPATSFTVLGGVSDRSIVMSTIVGKGGLSESLKTRGGPHRLESQLIEVHLKQLSMQHEVYPEYCREASRQIVVLRSFEIIDKLDASDFNKLLHLHSSSMLPRQSNANMFSLKCVNLRPDGGRGPIPEETNISVSLQPLRINIDQDTLLFVVDFFSQLFPALSALSPPANQIVPVSPGKTTAVEETRGMSIRYSRNLEAVEIQPEYAEEATEDVPEEVDEDDLDAEMDGSKATSEMNHERSATPNQTPTTVPTSSPSSKSLQPYIRTFIFSRDVPIRIDYCAKYLDLSQGALAGLLTGLTSLNCSGLTLKKVYYRNGIAGLDKLMTLLITDWLADIRQNQIPQILGGVGPMHSVLQLLQGVKDLVLMPVEQYQKDGRILRGLQRGAHSFTSSTAMSLLDITNRFLGVIKFAAELAFDIMSPEGAVVQGKVAHPAVGRRRAGGPLRRPNDMREGVFNAFAIVQEGFDETARSLAVAVATEHARRGLSGAVGGILRQVPSNLVRPVIMATTATSNVLEGVKCHVAPDSRRDEEDKWKQTQT